MHLSTPKNIITGIENRNRGSKIDIEHFIGIGIEIGIEVNFGIVPSLVQMEYLSAKGNWHNWRQSANHPGKK